MPILILGLLVDFVDRLIVAMVAAVICANHRAVALLCQIDWNRGLTHLRQKCVEKRGNGRMFNAHDRQNS
jgi:hypothetical protein